MFNKLKYIVYGVIGLGVVYVLVIDQDGSDSIRADLDQVLNVAVESLDTIEGQEGVNKDNAMDKFAETYSSKLNTSQPALHTGTVGVATSGDGSFDAYADDNNNATQDSGEKDLFKLEIDDENKRLIASDESSVRDHGFSGTGLIAGMLLGSMLSRQRASGRKPAGGRTTTSKSAYKSARSRASSGSHSRGK